MLDYKLVIDGDKQRYLHITNGLDYDGTGKTICGMSFRHGPKNANAKFVWSNAWRGQEGYTHCLECTIPYKTWHTCETCGIKTLDGNCPDHPAIVSSS